MCPMRVRFGADDGKIAMTEGHCLRLRLRLPIILMLKNHWPGGSKAQRRNDGAFHNIKHFDFVRPDEVALVAV